MKYLLSILCLFMLSCSEYIENYKFKKIFEKDIDQKIAKNIHSKINGTWKRIDGSEYTEIIDSIHSSDDIYGDLFNDKSYGKIAVGSQYRHVLGGLGAYRLFRIINDSIMYIRSHTKVPDTFNETFDKTSFYLKKDTLFLGLDTLIKTKRFSK